MPLPSSEVRQLVTRLADRRAGRTEANVQSDLHMLLAAGPLDLGDDKVQDIVLESPAGQRRRIDVETGFTVFEVKRDLRTGRVRQDAVLQLAGYVASRAEAMQQRYVGVLTDGAEWHLYSLAGDELTLVSSLEIDPKSPDVDGLCLWASPTGNVAYSTVANSLRSGLGSGQPVTVGAVPAALSRELALSGGVEDCFKRAGRRYGRRCR